MTGYIAVLIEADSLAAIVPAGPSEDPVTYAHPSPALAKAQTLHGDWSAHQDEPVVAALVIVSVDDQWGACCPDCYVGAGRIHRCPSRVGSAVMLTEAVFRPAGQVRT